MYDAVFNLIEGVQVKEMEGRIEKYRRSNAESIARNEARRVRAFEENEVLEAFATHSI